MSLRAATAALTVAAAAGQVTVLESSRDGGNWVNRGTVPWAAPTQSEAYVTVNRARTYQTHMGFGGALTDTSAINYLLMNDTSKQAFLDAYWGDVSAGSLGYNVHRIAINSPDYANITFNYDNITDDFELKHFDDALTYDHEHVIPLIRAAAARAAWNLTLFASPWSPPGWMKGNGNMISSSAPCLKPDTPQGSYKQAWADYFVRWLAGMRAAGVEYWGVTIQNEVMANQSTFESCLYSPEELRDFARDYLGPTLKAAFPGVRIMSYDHNKVASLAYMQVMYGDPSAAAYIDGTALHYYDYFTSVAFDEVRAIHELDDSKFILATEACWLGALEEPWSVGELYALDIAADLNAWATGWVEWNVVLNAGGRGIKPGGPNHTGSKFGSAMLLLRADNGTEALLYQPTFYAIGHFSRFIRPGARRVHTAGGGVAMTGADYDAVLQHVTGKNATAPVPLVATAYVAPDGASAAVVVLNAGETAVTYQLRDNAAGAGGAPAAATLTIPPHGIHTLTYPLTAAA